jgi:hypothetical protein
MLSAALRINAGIDEDIIFNLTASILKTNNMKRKLTGILILIIAIFCSQESAAQCDNVTSGGTIGTDQSGCNSFNPANITNITFPSGGTGTIEYQWQLSTDGVSWTDISGATIQNYDPTTIFFTRYYKRLSRRSGCTAYDGISNTVVKTVNPLPSPSITAGGPTTFCSPGNVTLTVNTAGLAYQWRDNGSNISGATNQNFIAVAPGNYSVHVTNTATGCVNTSNTIAVTVEFPLTTTISEIGFGMCTGSTTILQVQSGTGNFYQWFEDAHLLPNTNNYQYNTGHNGTYSCTITNSCGSYPSSPYQLNSIWLAAQPYGTIYANGSTSICSGGSVALAEYFGWQYFAGYQWYKDGLPIQGEVSYYYTATQPGEYILRVTDYCWFTGAYYDYYSNLITVTQQAAIYPAVSISAGGPTVFCPGGNVLLTAVATGSNLTYQWQQYGINISGATNQTYSVTAASNYMCTVSNICGTATSNSITISVLPVSVAISLNGNTVICNGAFAPLTSTSAGSGGTYQWKLNGSNVAGATQSVYSATATGSYSCSITNACGTFNSNAIAISVSPTCGTGLFFDGANDYVLIPNNSAYSFGTGDFTIETWVKVDPGQMGGQSILISNRTSGFNGFTLFLYAYYLTFTTDGGSVYVNHDLRDNLCHHIALSRVGGLLKFYIDGVLISGSTFMGTSVTTTGLVSLGSMPAGGSYYKGYMMEARLWNISRTQAQIQNSMNNVLAGNETGLAGYWRLNDGSGQVVNDFAAANNDGQLGSTSAIDANDPGFAATCPINGCALPAASVTAAGATTFCIGGSVTLNANTGGGLTHQWKLNGANIGGATASSYVATGSGTYTCVVTNGCGGTTSNSISVMVNTAPTATITAGGATTICNGSSVLLSANTGNGLSYQWSVDGGTIALATASTYSASAAGTYECVVTNSCGSATSNAISLTVNSLPLTPVAITGSTSVCTSSFGVNYSIAPVAGATYYTWMVPAGAVISAGQGTATITVDYGGATSGGSLCVSASNACGSSSPRCITITVSSLPVMPNAITGSGIACANTTGNVYEITGVTGANSFTWTIPTGTSFVSGQGTSSITVSFGSNGSSGSICVYAGNGCGTNFTCKNITAVTAPAVPASISGTSTPCANTTGVQFSCAAVGNAASYSWTVPATATITGGQGTTTISVNFNASFSSGTVGVSAVNCGGTSAQRTLQVYGIPAMPAAITGSSNGVCAGASNVPYTISAVPGATSYSWTAPSNASIVNGQGTTSVLINFGNGFSSGTLFARAVNACGTGAARTLALGSEPAMPGNITGPATFCSNQQGVIYSIAAVAGATTYQWDKPVGATIVNGQGTTGITVNYGTHSGKIKVRAGNACGYSAYRILNVNKTCREGEIPAQPGTNFDVNVFPNPSSTHFTLTVNHPTSTHFDFILRDLTGREIEKRYNVASGEKMEFGFTLAKGIYLAEVRAGADVKLLKVIRQE